MRKTIFGTLTAVMLFATPALAQQDAETNVRTDQTRVQAESNRDANVDRGNQRLVAKAMRISNLMDLEVRDLQNEEVGDVEDIVLDLEKGEIRYVALSVGSTLGLGGKLVAVPWNAFRVQQQDDQWVLTVNAAAQKFEDAPGFDENNWPNFADQNWQTTNDRYYNEQGFEIDRREGARTTRTQVEVEDR